MSALPAEKGVAADIDTQSPRLCPICGMANAHDAVFCANPACDKALGDFLYVEEELKKVARWHETLAEHVTGFVGKPHFLVIHIAWIGVWIALNTGIIAMLARFDAYPFSLLGLILAIESLFLSGSVLIAQNRDNSHAKKSARLDYEVNVLTYRKITEIDTLLRDLAARVEQLEAQNAVPLSAIEDTRNEP